MDSRYDPVILLVMVSEDPTDTSPFVYTSNTAQKGGLYSGTPFVFAVNTDTSSSLDNADRSVSLSGMSVPMLQPTFAPKLRPMAGDVPVLAGLLPRQWAGEDVPTGPPDPGEMGPPAPAPTPAATPQALTTTQSAQVSAQAAALRTAGTKAVADADAAADQFEKNYSAMWPWEKYGAGTVQMTRDNLANMKKQSRQYQAGLSAAADGMKVPFTADQMQTLLLRGNIMTAIGQGIAADSEGLHQDTTAALTARFLELLKEAKDAEDHLFSGVQGQIASIWGDVKTAVKWTAIGVGGYFGLKALLSLGGEAKRDLGCLPPRKHQFRKAPPCRRPWANKRFCSPKAAAR